MSLTRLILLSATYHWRTNLAVCLGVAAAVAVLSGALLVGESVRGSLREIALSRLGRTGHAISSTGFFREALAAELSKTVSAPVAPLVATTGFITHEASGRRASAVLVYGIDDRFWQFHGLERREGVFASAALAAELNAEAGDVLLTRLQKPSEIPLESLFANKDDVARTVRLTLTEVLPRDRLGEFSLQPQQAEVRAVFAPLRRLQRDLVAAGQVNTILLPDSIDEQAAGQAFRTVVTLEDLGIRILASGASGGYQSAAAAGSTSDAPAIAITVESASGVISEPLERAARDAASSLGLRPIPVFTYLANTIRIDNRDVPYSLVTGIDLGVLPKPIASSDPRTSAPERLASSERQRPNSRQAVANPAGRTANPGTQTPGNEPGSAGPVPIVLNEWIARELNAAPGDRAELEYYLWDPSAGLRTASAQFFVSSIVPMTGVAGDRRLAPEYPGITGRESLADWDPPFPLDLSRVRKQDEDYWDKYRATPKAFIPYERGRDLWSTRYGGLTGMRLPVAPGQDGRQLADSLTAELRRIVVPASQGLVFTPVRRLALAGATGATNFGEYFTYFSFFIVVSALMLAMLFFRLGVEGRLRQIGILRTSGFTTAHVRRMLLAEALVLALVGSAIGLAGAVGYAHLIVFGLRTWWVGAVGTTLLSVHTSASSLVAGALGGIGAALVCVFWSLRPVARRSPRDLLASHSLDLPPGSDSGRSRRTARFGVLAAVLGMSLMTLGFVSPATQAGAFFGAGAVLLTAVLLFLSSWLRASDARAVRGRGGWAVSRLGFRGAAFRPARSVLSAALVAAATFIIVSVDAFRREGGEHTADPRSGTGGFALLAQSEVPIVHNPNEPGGRDALLLRAPELSRVRFSRFRLRPGEDASCLNLYRPGNPAIIAPEPAFIESNRFTFAESLAESDAERANPWLLLDRKDADGAVPVIADATSLQYVLHASVGDTMSLATGGSAPLVLRFVGALRDSVLQGQFVMGEANFVRLFPGHEGFRFFLIDAPDVKSSEEAAALAEVVERELATFGVDAVSTTDRLDAFHRVENTYLSTFQALGGLGLLLGTVGLATVMFRNVLERRRELALLRAVGYNARHVTLMILAETALLLASGVVAGATCALIAIAPAWIERGSAPGPGLGLLLTAVLVAGLLSAVAATRAALSGELLRALRAE